MTMGRTGVISVDETTERARRAVKTFRAMQATLTAYARALTGDPKVRVEMATHDNGSTDGARIFMRPPIALGDRFPHIKNVCDKRDENLQLLCPACESREVVYATLYHEIGHIAFETFTEVSEAAKQKAILAAIRETGGRRAEAITERIVRASSSGIGSYLGLASYVNGFLPTLVNSMEDARVDLKTFEARTGTRKMFDADVWRTFEKGVEQKDKDGNVVVLKWSEYPQNSQAMVGVYCKLLNYNYQTWFHPKVVEALDDLELTDLVSTFRSIQDAEGVYNLAFQVMDKLREYGFLGTPEDPIPDPPEPEEEPETDDQEEEPESGGSAEAEVPPEEGESSDEGADSGTSPSAEGGGDPGGEAEPEEQSEQAETSPSSSGPDSASDGDEDSLSEGEAGEDSGEGSDVDDQPERDDTSESGTGGGAETAPAEDTEGSSEGSEDASEPDESQDGGERGDEGGTPADPAAGADEADSTGGDDTPGLGVDSDDHLDESRDAGSDDQLGDEGSERSTDQLDKSVDDRSEAEQGDGEAEPSGVEDAHEGDAGDDREGLIDQGADDGYGGTKIIEAEPEMGTPEQATEALDAFGMHEYTEKEEKPKSVQASREENALDIAIVQGLYFTTPSTNITGVREHTFDKHYVVEGHDFAEGWTHEYWGQFGRSTYSADDIEIDEKILTNALLEMRVAFSDNKRGKHLRHRKYGKVDARVLGKRAFQNDPRLFKKKITPGKKDYFVIIAFDISGSTAGVNLAIEKMAVMAQAELLDRLGVPFAVYAHSGDYHSHNNWYGLGMDMDMYLIKTANDPWSSKEKHSLQSIGAHSVNLDGHSLEYYRKELDRHPATDKIIMYYTDGKMPAENEDEELVILQREIKTCRNKGYTLMGVGIRTDSPRAHGLDTVQLDSQADIPKVVKHLQRRLLD